MHPQTCKSASPTHVHERGRQESGTCVQGQASGEATPLCVHSKLCRAVTYAVRTRKRMEQEVGVRVRSQGSSGKGEHKTERELTEGKERKIKNMGEDVQSAAQARKRRRRERKGMNKGNICHTENTLDEKQA